jgi:hypothetical protein
MAKTGNNSVSLKRDKYDVFLNITISKRLMDKIKLFSLDNNRSVCDICRRVLYKFFLNENIN